MSGERYEHSETGWVLIFALGSGLVLSAAVSSLVFKLEGARAPLLLPPLFIFLLLNFFRLTVSVDAGEVRLAFGIGLISKRFRLEDIAAAGTAKSSFLRGWGIRYTGKGWLFNVNSREAVELKMKDGREYMIGTDEPARLLEAVQAALNRGGTQ